MRRLRHGRAGISSVVGSIFFVLIMVVSIASLVTIFNSFTAYNQQVSKAGNTGLQVAATALSVTSDQFGSFPPSAPSNFNVATACSTTSTSPTNREKVFYTAGMWWDFYTCNSAFQYSTSFDGVTWEATTPIPAVITAGYTIGPYFDVEVIGTAFYLAIAKDGASAFQLGIGTLAAGGTYADPAGSITWTDAPAQVTTTANAFGPINMAVDGSGNQWVAVVQGTCTTTVNCAIAFYEHDACATAAGNGWEPNACSSSTAPTNYAPAALATLSANVHTIIFPAPSTLSSLGCIFIYETGSATNPSTGTLGVITQTTLHNASPWNTITLSGISDYSLTASSAVMVGTTLYFAGLANAALSQTTGTLRFWTLPFASMSVAVNSAEQIIESGVLAWQAALTTSGNTLVLFDNPSSSTIQYYTSSTLGSIWSSPAITLESAETAINGLCPASGAFAITWSNTANNVRFAALSTVSVTNSSPFGVHVVDLYVQNPSANLLAAHYYYNSTEDFDYWIGQGSTMTIPIRFTWAADTSYLFTIGTDTGVTAQLTSTSPPVSTTTCSSGSFLSQLTPALTCSSEPAAEAPVVAFTSNANTCTDTTSGADVMTGLGVTYTTSANSTGSIYAILTFNVASPAVANVNSKWEIAYGTGAVPACNGAATGTPTGQQYTLNTEAAASLSESQSEGVTITGLSPGTQYWFDVQALDSTAGAWVYSLPSMSVNDILTSGLEEPQLGYSSSSATCTISSVATEMAGLATTYTTGGSSFSGNVHLTLTMDVKSPAASGLNSQFRLAYGTGTAPVCAAASTGTSVGNQYQVGTEAAVLLERGRSESVVITGLTQSTTYWFDVQVTDSSAASWIFSNPTLAVEEMPTTQNLPANLNFVSNANSCARNTAANAMAGFGTTYTTTSSSTGAIFGVLTFKVASPATAAVNTKWQISYGTGAVPACNGAAAGTTVGRQYTINTEAAVAGVMTQTIGFSLTGLTEGTQYWFDAQATDSSVAVWTYSNPQLSVMDVMPADFVHGNAEFTSNANSCVRSTAATAMAGFALSYTPRSFGEGNDQLILTFNVASPSTAALTSKWQLAYGTGTAPACNAASVGTTIGNQYTVEVSAVGGGGLLSVGQSEGVVVLSLTPGTRYWFDVQVTDSTTGTWTYSNPELSVVGVP